MRRASGSHPRKAKPSRRPGNTNLRFVQSHSTLDAVTNRRFVFLFHKISTTPEKPDEPRPQGRRAYKDGEPIVHDIF